MTRKRPLRQIRGRGGGDVDQVMGDLEQENAVEWKVKDNWLLGLLHLEGIWEVDY